MAMLFLPGFSDQAVVMVELLLPLLAALFGASVKLMLVPEFTVTVSDSFSVALRATAAIFELAGPAAALNAGSNTTAAQTKAKLRMGAFILSFLSWNGETTHSPGSSNPGPMSKFGTRTQYSQSAGNSSRLRTSSRALVSPDWSTVGARTSSILKSRM